MEPIEKPINYVRKDDIIIRGYRQSDICGNLT